MRLVSTAFALLLGTAACAAEIEGIKLPPRVQLGADGPNLVLNGAGVRVRLIFNVYVAALYLPAKSDNGEAILRRDQPTRFMMHMLRTLSAEQVNGSITEALRETLTAEERQPLDARMARFSAIFDALREVKEGTQVTLDYLPAQGTVVSVNGEEKERIPGADFIQALLRVWLGERPRDPELRKALLGIGAQ
jgi:long-chain acyl-CoA synthetase